MNWTWLDDLSLLGYTAFQVFIGFFLGCTFILSTMKNPDAPFDKGTEQPQVDTGTCE